MVETAIYGLIGALATALLFLLALPAISARAHRLAARRAALTAPLNAAEAQARLDAERAKRAVEVARAERNAGDARDAQAQAQIELGRRANEIAARDAALAETRTRLAESRTELGARVADLKARDTEISAREIALRDFEGQRDAADRRVVEATARMRAQRVEAETARAELERRIGGLAQELSELRRASELALARADDARAETRRRLSASERDARALQERGETLTLDAAEAARREASLAARVAALNEARQEVEASLQGARADRDAFEREAGALRAELEAAEARVRDVEAGDASLRDEIARIGRALAQTQAAGAERV